MKKITALLLAVTMSLPIFVGGCGGQKEYTMSEALDTYQLWFECYNGSKDDIPRVCVVKDDTITSISTTTASITSLNNMWSYDDPEREQIEVTSDLTLSDISKMSDDEIIKHYSVYDKYPEIHATKNLDIHIRTDDSGNNTKIEAIAEPITDNIRVFSYDTCKMDGFDIYDAHFAGYKDDDGCYFVTRVKDADISFTLDKPNTNGIETD